MAKTKSEIPLAELVGEKSLRGWKVLGVFRDNDPSIFIGNKVQSADDPVINCYSALVYPDEATAKRNISFLEDDLAPDELKEGEQIGIFNVTDIFGFRFIREGSKVDKVITFVKDETPGGLKGFVKEETAKIKDGIKKRSAAIKEFQRETVKDLKILSGLKGKPAKKAAKRKPVKKAKRRGRIAAASRRRSVSSRRGKGRRK